MITQVHCSLSAIQKPKATLKCPPPKKKTQKNIYNSFGGKMDPNRSEAICALVSCIQASPGNASGRDSGL